MQTKEPSPPELDRLGETENGRFAMVSRRDWRCITRVKYNASPGWEMVRLMMMMELPTEG